MSPTRQDSEHKVRRRRPTCVAAAAKEGRMYRECGAALEWVGIEINVSTGRDWQEKRGENAEARGRDAGYGVYACTERCC